MQNPIPDFARTVLVPVSNPHTAPELIRIACALVHPEQGRLLAAFISRGDSEADSRATEAIEAQIDSCRTQLDCPVELITHVSTSIARGILDLAREEGADLLVLGLRQPERGHVELGSIAENVLDVAPCDVLVWRMGRGSVFRRILVPVDGTPQSRTSSRVGIVLAERFGVPIEAIHIVSPYQPRWEGQARLDQSLTGLQSQEIVHRKLISADQPVAGLLSEMDADDLTVVTISRRAPFERWLFGDISRALLNSAPGPVALVGRSISVNGRPATGFSRLVNWFTLRLTQAERDELLWQGSAMASSNLDYIILILVSCLLASMGLLLNSPAVIIGAMLVAPLMQPLIGLAAGMSVGEPAMIRRGLFTLLQGTALAVLVSALIGLLVGPAEPTTEMLGRSSPGLLDAGVALASGLIGAYATARKDIPSALAGVAIAAALMPPLCTVGLYLGMGWFPFAWQAALLFFTNIVCISVAAYAIFYWAGLRPEEGEAQHRAGRGLALGSLIALALTTVFVLLSFSGQRSQRQIILTQVEQSLPETRLGELTIQPGETLRVELTLYSAESIDRAQAEALQAELTRRLAHPVDLTLIPLPLLHAGD